MMESQAILRELKIAINSKTKPLGALGRLEEIALQIGIIQNTTKPTIHEPHILVFAADHGIAATGLVNPYPQEVTAQMVLNFFSGGAAINVFCRQNRIHLKVIDAGVNHDFSQIKHENFISAKIARGTTNYLKGPAMSEELALKSIEKGKDIVRQIADETRCNCIGLGEMGIGNTSSASLIMAAILQLPIQQCTGRGTGTSEHQLHTKIQTLKKVYTIHHLQDFTNSPVNLISKIGGFEIAMMTGAYVQAFEESMIIVVDGFISTAAFLLAFQIKPEIIDNCIFAHSSGEKGHALMLDYLKAKPILNMGLRLGEGTGAALAIPLIQSAINFLNEMASFQSASISNKIE